MLNMNGYLNYDKKYNTQFFKHGTKYQKQPAASVATGISSTAHSPMFMQNTLLHSEWQQPLSSCEWVLL